MAVMQKAIPTPIQACSTLESLTGQRIRHNISPHIQEESAYA